jgi:hypothetical protein
MRAPNKLEAMVSLFEQAAETGTFTFDKVPFEDWMKFMKQHSKIKSINFGSRVRDTALVAELKRLAGVARDLINPPAN